MKQVKLDRSDRTLIIAVLLGPLAWLALLTAAWQTVPGANEYGRVGMLRLLAVIAAVFPIIAGVLAVREMRLATGDQSDAILQRRRFMAIAAFVGAVFSLLLVIGTAIPMFMLEPGAEP